MSFQDIAIVLSNFILYDIIIEGGDAMRQKVFDIHWIISMSIWLIATFGCFLSFIIDKKANENILYAFIVLFALFIALLFRPVYVEFDKECLTIHFLFGFFQRFNWNDIWKIERQGIPSDIRYFRVFGDSYGKKAFFTSAIIPYNQKNRQLLNTYWNEDYNN